MSCPCYGNCETCFENEIEYTCDEDGPNEPDIEEEPEIQVPLEFNKDYVETCEPVVSLAEYNRVKKRLAECMKFIDLINESMWKFKGF